MNNIEKEFHYNRLAIIHYYCGHKIRYWFYKKLSKYYSNKHYKEFINKD